MAESDGSEKFEMPEFSLWDVNRRQGSAVKSARCARVPADLKPLGCCEFVGGVVDSTVTARTCYDGTFCPFRVFSDPTVYASCPARLEKLKLKKEQT